MLEIVDVITIDTVHIPVEGRPANLAAFSVAPIFGVVFQDNYHRPANEGFCVCDDD